MKSKILYLSLVGIALIGMSFFVYPLLKGEAQKNQEKVEKQNEALQKIRENVTATMFYDNLQLKEPEWNLLKSYVGNINDNNSVFLPHDT